LLRQAIDAGEVAVCDPVILELLCWSGSEAQATRLQSMMAYAYQVPQLTYVDVVAAGRLFRACRRAGETVRRANDCLIAAIALRAGLPVLHRDRDYDVIARHAPLQLVST
jgi:predicted nucleic acid-binding protein